MKKITFLIMLTIMTMAFSIAPYALGYQVSGSDTIVYTLIGTDTTYHLINGNAVVSITYDLYGDGSDIITTSGVTVNSKGLATFTLSHANPTNNSKITKITINGEEKDISIPISSGTPTSYSMFAVQKKACPTDSYILVYGDNNQLYTDTEDFTIQIGSATPTTVSGVTNSGGLYELDNIGEGNDVDINQTTTINASNSNSSDYFKLHWGDPYAIQVEYSLDGTNYNSLPSVISVNTDQSMLSNFPEFRISVVDVNGNYVRDPLSFNLSSSYIQQSSTFPSDASGWVSSGGIIEGQNYNPLTKSAGYKYAYVYFNSGSKVEFLNDAPQNRFALTFSEDADSIQQECNIKLTPGNEAKYLIQLDNDSQDDKPDVSGVQIKAGKNIGSNPWSKIFNDSNIVHFNVYITDKYMNRIPDSTYTTTATLSINNIDSKLTVFEKIVVSTPTNIVYLTYPVDSKSSIKSIKWETDSMGAIQVVDLSSITVNGTAITLPKTIDRNIVIEYDMTISDFNDHFFYSGTSVDINNGEGNFSLALPDKAKTYNIHIADSNHYTGDSTDIQVIAGDPNTGDYGASVVYSLKRPDLYVQNETHNPLITDLSPEKSADGKTLTVEYDISKVISVWETDSSGNNIRRIALDSTNEFSGKSINLDAPVSQDMYLKVLYESVDFGTSKQIRVNNPIYLLNNTAEYTNIYESGTKVTNYKISNDGYTITFDSTITGQISVSYLKAYEIKANDAGEVTEYVKVYDPYDNLIPNYPIDIIDLNGNISFLDKPTTTGASGTAAVKMELGTAAGGKYQIYAKVVPPGGTEVSHFNGDTMYIVPGTPKYFKLMSYTFLSSSTDNSKIMANEENKALIVAQAIDNFGNDIYNNSGISGITWKVDNGGQFSFSKDSGYQYNEITRTNLNALGQISVYLKSNPETGTIHTVTCSSNVGGLTSQNPLQLTVVPGYAFKLSKISIIYNDKTITDLDVNVPIKSVITAEATILDFYGNKTNLINSVSWWYQATYKSNSQKDENFPDYSASPTDIALTDGITDVRFQVSSTAGDEFRLTAHFTYNGATASATSNYLIVMQGIPSSILVKPLFEEVVTADSSILSVSHNISNVLGVWDSDQNPISADTNIALSNEYTVLGKTVTFKSGVESGKSYKVFYTTDENVDISTSIRHVFISAYVTDSGGNPLNDIQLNAEAIDVNQPNDPYKISSQKYSISATLSNDLREYDFVTSSLSQTGNTYTKTTDYEEFNKNGFAIIDFKTSVFAGDDWKIRETLVSTSIDLSGDSQVVTVSSGEFQSIKIYSEGVISDANAKEIDGKKIIIDREKETLKFNGVYAQVSLDYKTDQNYIIYIQGDDGKYYSGSLKDDGKTIDFSNIPQDVNSVYVTYFPLPLITAGYFPGGKILLKGVDEYGNLTNIATNFAISVDQSKSVDSVITDTSGDNGILEHSFIDISRNKISNDSTLTLSGGIYELYYYEEEADDPDPMITITWGTGKDFKLRTDIRAYEPKSVTLLVNSTNDLYTRISTDSAQVSADWREVSVTAKLVDKFGNLVDKSADVNWGIEQHIENAYRTRGFNDLLPSFSSTQTIYSTMTVSESGETTVNFYTSTVAGEYFVIKASAIGEGKSIPIYVTSGNPNKINGNLYGVSKLISGDVYLMTNDPSKYLGILQFWLTDKYGNEIINSSTRYNVNAYILGKAAFAPEENSTGEKIYKYINNEEYITSKDTKTIYSEFSIMSTPTVVDNYSNSYKVISYSDNSITLNSTVSANTRLSLAYKAKVDNIYNVSGLNTPIISGQTNIRNEKEGFKGKNYIMLYSKNSGSSTATISVTIQGSISSIKIPVVFNADKPSQLQIRLDNNGSYTYLKEYQMGKDKEVGTSEYATMDVVVKDSWGNIMKNSYGTYLITFDAVGEVENEIIQSDGTRKIMTKYPINTNYGIISVKDSRTQTIVPYDTYINSSNKGVITLSSTPTEGESFYVSYYTHTNAQIAEDNFANLQQTLAIPINNDGSVSIRCVQFGTNINIQDDIIVRYGGFDQEDHDNWVKFYFNLASTTPQKIQVLPVDGKNVMESGEDKTLQAIVMDRYGNAVNNYSGTITFSINGSGYIKEGKSVNISQVDKGEKDVTFSTFNAGTAQISAMASPGGYSTDNPLTLAVLDTKAPVILQPNGKYFIFNKKITNEYDPIQYDENGDPYIQPEYGLDTDQTEPVIGVWQANDQFHELPEISYYVKDNRLYLNSISKETEGALISYYYDKTSMKKINVLSSDPGSGINLSESNIKVYRYDSNDLLTSSSISPNLLEMHEKVVPYDQNTIILKHSVYKDTQHDLTITDADGNPIEYNSFTSRMVTFSQPLNINEEYTIDYYTLNGLKWNYSTFLNQSESATSGVIYKIESLFYDNSGNVSTDTSYAIYDPILPARPLITAIYSIVGGNRVDLNYNQFVPKSQYPAGSKTLMFTGRTEINSTVVFKIKTDSGNIYYNYYKTTSKATPLFYSAGLQNFSCSVELPEDSVKYTVEVYAQDEAENESDHISPITFVIDKNPPFIELHYPKDGKTIKNVPLLINATAKDYESGIDSVYLFMKHYKNEITSIGTIEDFNSEFYKINLNYGVENVIKIAKGDTTIYSTSSQNIVTVKNENLLISKSSSLPITLTVGSTLTVTYKYLNSYKMLQSESNEYNVILPSDCSTDDIYYYVRAYDQSGLSSRYPVNGFYKFTTGDSKSSIIAKSSCKIEINGFFEADFPDRALLKDIDVTLYAPKTTVTATVEDSYIISKTGEKLIYKSMQTYSYGEKRSIVPYSELLYNLKLINAKEINDFDSFVEIVSMIDGKARSIIFNRPVDIYYTIKVPKSFTDYDNLTVMYYDYLDNLWFPIQTQVATISGVSDEYDYVKLKASTNHFSLFGIFEKPNNAKGGELPADSTMISGVVISKNPFVAHVDNQTSINFNINQDGVELYLYIYDISGRLVYQVTKHYSSRTSDTLTWNGLNRFDEPLPSGPYVLVLRATSPSGDQMIVKKVIMMVK